MALASQMHTSEDSAQMREFTGNRTEQFAKSTKGIDQALEIIETNRQWHDFNYLDIGRYLQEATD